MKALLVILTLISVSAHANDNAEVLTQVNKMIKAKCACETISDYVLDSALTHTVEVYCNSNGSVTVTKH